MKEFEIKKVIAVSKALKLKEAASIVFSDDYCLGVKDKNDEITGFITKEDLLKVLKLDIGDLAVSLITTLTDLVNINIQNSDYSKIKKFFNSGLNKGLFVGRDKKQIDYLVLNKDSDNNRKAQNLTEEYECFIPDKIKKALKYCYTCADEYSTPIYIVGGIVRDIIINSQNDDLSELHKKFVDIDINVEKNAIEFSQILAEKYKGFCEIKEIHEDFKTAKIRFIIDDEVVEFDIASARKESYALPASLPIVEDIGCNIFEDLIRRDFTINAMALSLNKASFCNLIDPFDGYSDISKKTIRILHPISFVDDPTRIIRAIKFATRFNYDIDPATEYLINSCINSGIFDNLAGERVKSELKQTFNQNKASCLQKFVNEKAYKLIDTDIKIPENINILAENCTNIINEYYRFMDSTDYLWLIYFGTLLTDFDQEKIIQISNKLYLTGFETEILLGTRQIINISKNIKESQTRFEVYELLEGYLAESVLTALAIVEDSDIKQKIALFQKELKYIEIYTTGKTLIESGLIPGPVFGEILRELLKAKINGEISTREDEKDYIKKISSKKFIN